MNHPGKRIAIHNIAELVGSVYPLAVCAKNILSGFSSSGIFPYNNNAYTDADFIAASVTDVPLTCVADISTTEHANLSHEPSEATKSRPFTEEPQPGCSNLNSHLVKIQKVKEPVLSPELLRPLPKCHASENSKKNRRKRKSEVLTDTPVKKRIEQESFERSEKKNKSKKKSSSNVLKLKIKKNKNKNLWKSSSSEDEDWKLSDSDNISEDEMEERESVFDDDLKERESASINIGDFALVKVCGKKKGSICYYVAEIINKSEIDFEVKYMKRLLPGYNFIFEDEKTYSAVFSDIEMKLPKPMTCGGTERTMIQLSFPVDFRCYSMIK